MKEVEGIDGHECVCDRERVRTHLAHPFPSSSSIVTLAAAAASAAALSANVVASERIDFASSREKKFSCRPYEWVAWMSGPTTKYIQHRASLTWLYVLASPLLSLISECRSFVFDEGRIISFVFSCALSRVCQNFE